MQELDPKSKKKAKLLEEYSLEKIKNQLVKFGVQGKGSRKLCEKLLTQTFEYLVLGKMPSFYAE